MFSSRSASALPFAMEENGSTRNNPKINTGLSHTFFSKASAYLSQYKHGPLSHSCVGRNVHHGSQNESTGHSKGSSKVPQLCVPSVSGAKIRRISPSNIQPQSAKRLCACRTFSPDKHVSHSGFFATKRLAMQSRSLPSVFSRKNSKVPQALLTPHIQQRIARNDVPPVRVKHGPQNILRTNKLGGSDITRKMECQNPCVSRRLLDSTPKCRHTSQTCQNDSSNIKNFRVEGQFREIGSRTSEEHNISGGTVETLGQSKISSKRKIHQDSTKSRSSSKTKTGNHKSFTENNRTSKLCQLCCPSRTAQSSTIDHVHEHLTRPVDKSLPTTRRRSQRTGLVDSKCSVVNTATLSSSGKFPNNRCVRSSLGGTAERFGSLRHLVERRTTLTLQPKRDAGHSTRPSKSSPCTASQLSFNPVRQQDCSRSSTKRRRYEINSAYEGNLSNITFARSTSNTLQHTLYPRQVQQSCRSFVPSSPPSRVAPVTSLCGNSVCKVGNPSDRFVCLGDRTCSLQLCVTRPARQSSFVSRRVQCSMELPTRVDISTTVSSPQSLSSPKSVNRNISHSSSPVGNGILARRPQSSSPGSTINTEKPTETPNRHVDGASTFESREHNSRSVEMWGWSKAVETWNTEQLSLLKNSWRKSTLKTYEVAWKRWTSWCNSKNVVVINPTGSQLAQFLSDLYLINNLSYNTILLHKSVVSTLCNADTSSLLSSHVLVRHILKSIALRNPKSSKSPVWDVCKLISFLKNYTVDSSNLFQISRHTAILLLLCSGRRIHDLTLLAIDPNHCIRSSDSIIFWPIFGSKTDCSNYRQSGWKLLINTDHPNLNPILWIEKTISLLNERRNTAKSFNLFVTVRGIAKPASRTVIAGWVKTLFKEAGITAPPGSVRSAVSSKSWLENHPLDDILARGNWRSATTFQRFYRREVLSTNHSENITQLFKVIN